MKTAVPGAAELPPALRDEIARRQTPEKPPASEAVQPASDQTEMRVQCPDCQSTRVRRRPRKAIERLMFTFTDHKAYVCRDCQALFYHRAG